MRPDIVLMATNRKGEIDGIETDGRIKRNFPVPDLFVPALPDEATISRARTIHTDGFLQETV